MVKLTCLLKFQMNRLKNVKKVSTIPGASINAIADICFCIVGGSSNGIADTVGLMVYEGTQVLCFLLDHKF